MYRAFSLNIRLPFPHDLRTGRRRGGPTLENTGEAGGQAIPSVRRAGDGGGLVQLHDLLVLIQVEQSSACKSECLG